MQLLIFVFCLCPIRFLCSPVWSKVVWPLRTSPVGILIWICPSTPLKEIWKFIVFQCFLLHFFIIWCSIFKVLETLVFLQEQINLLLLHYFFSTNCVVLLCVNRSDCVLQCLFALVLYWEIVINLAVPVTLCTICVFCIFFLHKSYKYFKRAL